jgi:predicted extracellular nuclease
MQSRSALPLLLTTLASASALAATPIPIGKVQGSGELSPMVDQEVTVRGVVTADFRSGLGGFYLQDEGDGDPATSDALYVRLLEGALAPPGFGVGARCEVTGTVVEAGKGARALTLIQPGSVGPCKPGAQLPQPQPVLAKPADWEPLEGMRVRIQAPMTVTATHALSQTGELLVSLDGRAWQPSELARPGTEAHRQLDEANFRSRLILDDGSSSREVDTVAYMGQQPVPRVGSLVTQAEGILEMRGGSWRLQVTSPVQVQPAAAPPAPQVEGTLKVAAFNLENLFNGDGRGQGFPTPRGARDAQAYQAQLDKLVATIKAMDADVAALMELENDGYGPDSSLAQLVDALNADGARWRFIDTGRGPGGDSIRVGLIYRQDRVSPRGKPRTLEQAPFGTHSRVPLAQAFVRKGGSKPLVVVANHFKSKGCSQAKGENRDKRDGQGCWNALRTESAQRLHEWLAKRPLGRKLDQVLVLGDFNAYAMEDPLHWLREEGGWTDAFTAAGVQSPYSYVYNGLSGRLDHALLSPALVPALRGAAHWHINADEPEASGYAQGNVPGPARSSDHDPLLLGFDL